MILTKLVTRCKFFFVTLPDCNICPSDHIFRRIVRRTNYLTFCVLAPKETSLFDYAVLKSMMHTVQYQLLGNYEHVCRVVSVSMYG